MIGGARCYSRLEEEFFYNFRLSIFNIQFYLYICTLKWTNSWFDRSRRDAGVVDRGGLENRYTFGYPGFESLSLRKMAKKPTTSALRQRFFYADRWLGVYSQATYLCIKRQLSEGKIGGSLFCFCTPLTNKFAEAYKTKKDSIYIEALRPFLPILRRERDSNPRHPFEVYALSRRAP